MNKNFGEISVEKLCQYAQSIKKWGNTGILDDDEFRKDAELCYPNAEVCNQLICFQYSILNEIAKRYLELNEIK